MPSKRQEREYQRKRQEQLERKHQERDQRRQRTVRITALVALAALIISVVGVALVSALGGEDPVASPEPTAPPEQSLDPEQPDQTAAPDQTASPDAPEDDDLVTTGWATSPIPPGPELAEGRTWTATFATNQGDITVELDGEAAPQAVASFVSLAQEGFFDRSSCHRLTTAGIFVLQCGDPTGTGTGGPAYRYGPIENAPADNVYPAGTLAMARVSGNGDSMGSQFFLVYEDSTIQSDMAGGYTVFGQVLDGLAIVEGVASAGTITGQSDGPPAQSVILNEVSVS